MNVPLLHTNLLPNHVPQHSNAEHSNDAEMSSKVATLYIYKDKLWSESGCICLQKVLCAAKGYAAFGCCQLVCLQPPSQGGKIQTRDP